MSFYEEVKDFSSKIDSIKNSIQTEESTKTAAVLPFFQLLGYDVFNPLEFVPEFTADTGTKKGEKVDYAIQQNNKPIMIVEVKPINANLSSKHINQLFRYFTVTQASFAILTNGIIYRFYSDLEEKNKMDLVPFLEIDLLNITQDNIKELSKFKKECFNIKGILGSASELKYTSLLKKAIEDQFNDPSEQFVRALIKNIYSGVKTQAVIDKFKTLTRLAINDYITDLINEKLQGIISSEEPSSENENSFLPEELEALDYIKQMLGANDVLYKKTKRYAYMHLENSRHKWICRIYIRQENNLLVLRKFESTTFETEYYFDDPDVLDQIKELFIQTYENCKDEY